MPRWRTMIDPAGTSWPSPHFTPRRWPTLSRPFLTLPPAFLWAIAYSSFLVARGLAAFVGAAPASPSAASALALAVAGFFVVVLASAFAAGSFAAGSFAAGCFAADFFV